MIWLIGIEMIIWYLFIKDFENKIYPICYTMMLLQNIVSLFTFQKEKRRLPKLFDYLLYVTCFPKLLFGPLISYFDMEEELKNRKCSKELFTQGCFLFLKGVFIEVLLVNSLLILKEELVLLKYSVLCAWLLLLITMLSVVLFMIGYSHISVGLANMLGFTWKSQTPMNFSNISEFFRSWHSSLTTFWTTKIKSTILCVILLSFFYGININLFCWFLWIGLGMKLEKLVGEKHCHKVVSFLWLFLSFVFFIRPNIDGIKVSFESLWMFPFMETEVLYYLKSYFILLVFSVIVCFGIGSKIIARLKNKFWFHFGYGMVSILLLIITMIFLISETRTSIWMFRI